METLIEKIKLSLSEVMNLEETSSITSETRLAEDLDMDSSMFIELLMTLEDHVEGLTFDPETLKKDDFKTVASLATYIQTLTNTVAA